MRSHVNFSFRFFTFDTDMMRESRESRDRETRDGERERRGGKRKARDLLWLGAARAGARRKTANYHNISVDRCTESSKYRINRVYYGSNEV